MSAQVYTNNYLELRRQRIESEKDTLVSQSDKLPARLHISQAQEVIAGKTSRRLHAQIQNMVQKHMNMHTMTGYSQPSEERIETIDDILKRVRELAVCSGEEAPSSDMEDLQKQVDYLRTEIERISKLTAINATQPADAAKVEVATETNAAAEIVAGDSEALEMLENHDNNLEYAVDKLNRIRKNLVSAGTRVRDLSMAENLANMAKSQILVSSQTAISAQTSRLSKTALKLINDDKNYY